MNKLFKVVIFLCFLRNAKGFSGPETEAKAVKELLHRLIPNHAKYFNINVDYEFHGKDAFQIHSEGMSVHITGNKGYSAAAGFYYYIKRYCGCHVSWSGNQLKLPVVLPKLDKPLKKTFSDKYRYYQNVCASSYSYVWWTWERWEKELDWMALNGINLALAFTAQEAIYQRVFKQMNLTTHDIEEFFTGPAFLAWNRMGNLQAWVGPLSPNWHAHQIELQHQILKRMISFGMIPVLPAFSGRVPPAIKRVFPEARTTFLNKSWGHFEAPFTYVTFLQPTDPLFQRIGIEFLRKYNDEFRSKSGFYSADLYNEMPPPSNDPSYIESSVKSMYKVLTTFDLDAIWLVQGWMFYSDPETWKETQARAFLRAIPLGKMIVLDLQSELYPQYLRLNSYFNQPFIWCMLHNYGGVTGLYGSLDNINKGVFEGRTFKGSSMIGTGLTPEGIETNDIVYEFMNEMALQKEPININKWLEQFVFCRYGTNSSDISVALQLLRKSVYNATAPYRNHGKYILVRRPSLKLKPYIWYNTEDVFEAWKLFLNFPQSSHLFRHDLVDLTRQSLQLLIDDVYLNVVRAYKKRNITSFMVSAERMLHVLDDLEAILSSDELFLLGRWLQTALQLAHTPLERVQYEYNARNQITLWGPTGQLLDYANKQWAGLISEYYKKRWQLFLESLLHCLLNGFSFKQEGFNKKVFDLVESAFDLGREKYLEEPKGDAIEISKNLFKKYNIHK